MQRTDELTPRTPTDIVSRMASDSYTWNLVYLGMLIEGLGYHLINLRPCVVAPVLEPAHGKVPA